VGTREESGTPPLPSPSPGGAHVDPLWYAKQSYGISRQRLYQILDEELDDAEGKLRAAGRAVWRPSRNVPSRQLGWFKEISFSSNRTSETEPLRITD